MKNKDVEYRLYISKNGQLRMITDVLENDIVRSINVLELNDVQLSINDDLNLFFTGYGNIGNFRNKVIFTD